jgi:hypothetical protein
MKEATMTIDMTVHVWEYSRQRGDGLVLLLALADNVDHNGQGRKPSGTLLTQRTRLTLPELDITIQRVCDAGELVWGLGNGLGRDRFVITLDSPFAERVTTTPWGPETVRRDKLPEAGHIIVARATTGVHKGLHRIARGKNADKRFAQLRSELAEDSDLVLARAIPTSDMDGAKGHLDRLFRSWRVEGDWFYLPPEMVTWLTGLEALEPPPTA